MCLKKKCMHFLNSEKKKKMRIQITYLVNELNNDNNNNKFFFLFLFKLDKTRMKVTNEIFYQL